MNLIVKIKFGAHLYGIDTSGSDIDYRGVFLPSPEEILKGDIPKCRHFTTGDNASKNKAGDVDEDIYALHHFIKLACEGQVAAVDMLHAPEEFLLVNTDIWRDITAQRKRFYSKQLGAFVPYVLRQVGKYGFKGSRLDAAKRILDLLKTKAPQHKLRMIWVELPLNEHCRDLGKDPNGLRQYQVCGKIFLESVAVGHVIPILQKFWDDFGRRARLAGENKEIDWKAVSHAFRAALQVREILTTHTLVYPLRDAPFLTRVKQGRLDFATEAAPALEALVDEVRLRLESSPLPEQADTAYWEKFLAGYGMK